MFTNIGNLMGIRNARRGKFCDQTYLANTWMYEHSWIYCDHHIQDTSLPRFPKIDVVSPFWKRGDDGVLGERWDRESKGFNPKSNRRSH